MNRATMLITLLATTGLLGACAGVTRSRSLDEAAFVRVGSDPSTSFEIAGPPVPIEADVADTPSGVRVVRLEDGEVLPDARATPGAPEIDPASPANDEGAVLIDELVGEVNGQPIFANEFLTRVSSRIAQIPVEFEREMQRPPTDFEWRREAGTIISGELSRIIRDELVSAESYRTLEVPEQNLRRFLEAWRKNEISLRGGSTVEADRTIQDELGLSTDELLELRGDEVVLQQYLNTFNAGISVSPRDIERYYHAHPEKYNPDPTVRFRWIWIEETDEEVVLRIGDELAETPPERLRETFERLARDPANWFRPEQGGLQETTFKGELTDLVLLRDPTINAALVRLEPGEMAGPVEHDGYVSWVYLESVRRVSQSLYDAQAEIEFTLRKEEFERRLDLEIQRLQERAGISDEQILDITMRLLDIAWDRFHE